MPVALAVSPPDRLGVVRLTGEVDGHEIVSAAAALAAHPDWQGGFRVVWDTSGMRSLGVLPRDLTALVAQDRQLMRDGKTGDLVIVARDSVWLALVRLFDRMMGPSGRQINVVPTVRGACERVGVDELPG